MWPRTVHNLLLSAIVEAGERRLRNARYSRQRPVIRGIRVGGETIWSQRRSGSPGKYDAEVIPGMRAGAWGETFRRQAGNGA